MLADGPTNVYALTPVIARLILRGAYVVLFSSNVDGADVDRRIGRCFARHKTARNSPLNGENQLEWSNADVPSCLWSFPGTTAV